MNEPTIVILGANGSLGRTLTNVLPTATAFTQEQLDITNKTRLYLKLDDCAPDVIINAAACTAVDLAEQKEAEAHLVNATAVQYLADWCTAHNKKFIHISTDYVFDGTKKAGYTEIDVPNPLNAYGRTKLAGENAALSCKNTILIRTSWLYGSNKSFPAKILAKATAHEQLRVVNDQYGQPTSAADLAKNISAMIHAQHIEPGIYHITNSGVATWYDVAVCTLNFAGITCPILPIKTNELNLAATRPQYSILRSTKTQSLRNWKEALCEYIQQHIEQNIQHQPELGGGKTS